MTDNPLNRHLLDVGHRYALRGMSMVRAVTIPAGTVLYRFYDKRRAPTAHLGAEGPWWLEYEPFQSIKHFGLRHGYELGYSARLFAAILYEWSDVNAFVACRTTSDLSAWKGRGKQVASSGADARDTPTMTPMQGMLEIYQLYVPGIGGPGSLGTQVLRPERSGPA